MRRYGVAAVALALSACAARNPEVAFKGQSVAPDNALSCSLRILAEQDYNPVQGGVADGFIKLRRTLPQSFANAMKERMLTGPGYAGDFVTVTGAGGALQIRVVGFNRANEAMKPSQDALANAQNVLSTCGGNQ